MAQKLTASMPENLDLQANYVVQITAVDPTTGALVSGINVSNVAIMAEQITPASSGGGQDLLTPVGPYLYVPGPNT